MIQNYITGLDKLHLTLTMQETIKDDYLNLFEINQYNHLNSYSQNGFTLTNLNKSTTNYNKVYQVEYNGVTFGTVQLDGRQNFLQDYIGLKIENELLRNTNCQKIINLFLHEFHVRINNFTALDIYIDTRTNLRDEFINLFNNKTDYIFNTKINKFGYYGECSANDYFLPENLEPSLYFGSNKTGKQVVIYNKTEELQAKDHKQSITELHNERLAHNPHDDVYRFELRLKNNYLKKNNIKIEFDSLFDDDYLKTIISENLPNFFEFRNNDNTHISRCSVYNFFDLRTNSSFKVKSVFSATNKDTQEYNSSSKPTFSNRDKEKKNKRMIVNLIKDAAKNLSKEEIEAIKVLAQAYNLTDFYFNEIKHLDFMKSKKEESKVKSIF